MMVLCSVLIACHPQEHLIHCGQVLEECPNGCNVFVPRIRMRSHLKECPRSKQQLQQRLSASMERLDQQLEPHRMQVLEQDIATIRSVLNEEIRQRLHLITDVGNIRKHNQVVEDWTRDTDECLAELRRLLGAETAQREYAIDQTQGDFQYCCNLTQVSPVRYARLRNTLYDPFHSYSH